MAKIPEEKLLTIMLTEGLISEKQVSACKLYQQEYFRKAGQEIPLAMVLAKLEILPEDKVASIIRAMESANIPSSAPSLLSREDSDEESDEPKAPSRPKPRISLASLPSKHSRLQSFSSMETDADEDEDEYEQPEEEEQEPVRYEKMARPTGKSTGVAAGAPPEKSLLVAYFLLLFGGFLGAHRLYLRYYRSGIFYTLTFGFLGLGIAIDLFLLPWLLSRYRKATAAEEMPSEFVQMAAYQDRHLTEKSPAWSKPEKSLAKLGSMIETLLKIIWLIAAPVALALVAVTFWNPFVPLLAWIWLSAYLGGRALAQACDSGYGWPHVPLLSFLDKNQRQFGGFYFMHSPRSILLYIFYPIWMPIAILIKKRRQEVFLYLWMVMAGIGLIALGLSCNFSLMGCQWTPALQQLLTRQLLLWSLAFILFLAIFVPTCTALAAARARKQATMGKIFGWWNWLISLALLVFLLFGANWVPWKSYSHQEAMRRVITRLQTPHYRQQITTAIKGLAALTDKTNLGADKAQEYSKTLQLLIQGVCPFREAELFKATHGQTPGKSSLLVIHAGSHPLAVIDTATLYFNWDKLPAAYDQAIAQICTLKIVCPRMEPWRRHFDLTMPDKKLLGDLK